jgi:hypothetical protein
VDVQARLRERSEIAHPENVLLTGGRSLGDVDREDHERHESHDDRDDRLEHVEQVDLDAPGADAEPFERPIDRFRRSTVGSVLAAGMLGLRDVLEPQKKEEAAIVSEAPTRPDDQRVRLLLDPEHPERSVVILRKPAD